MENATAAVSKIIASGMIPGAIEMMDRLILKAVEAAFHVGFSPDAGAVLIVEIDGLEVGLDERAAAAIELMRACGVTEAKLARDEAERALLWKARKRAFGAVGRLAPNYATQDGVVPRTRLPDILRVIHAVASATASRSETSFTPATATSIRSCCMMSAIAGQVRHAIEAGREILTACVEMGGSLTGEHGIGVEKMGEMPLLFSPDDLIAMAELRRVFDPDGRSNPGKVIPTPGAMRRSHFASKASPAVSIGDRESER